MCVSPQPPSEELVRDSRPLLARLKNRGLETLAALYS